MSILTLLIAAAMLYGHRSRHGYGVALAIAGITASGAAFIAGRIVVPTFYFAALGAAALILLPFFSGRRPARTPAPGVALLLAFFLYGAIVTAIAPLLFNGLPSITPNPGRLTAGQFTPSNFAQLIYLLLGICVVAYIARDQKARPTLVGVTVVGASILCFWRYLYVTYGIPFPEGVFDNSPVFAYIETAPGNVARFRGIFSEPAGVAASSLTTLAWILADLPGRRGGAFLWRILVAAAAIFMGVISTSTTFVVAGSISAAFAVLVLTISFLSRRMRIGASAAAVGLVLGSVAIFAAPAVIDFVQQAIAAKVGTSSFNNRSSVNGLLYDAFVTTFGLGAGLGSGRASSFIATLVGTTGVIGVALFVATLVLLIGRGTRLKEYRPVAWTLAVLLITKAVSGPDLSDSTGLLWISLGLLSQSVLRQRGDFQSLQTAAGHEPIRPTPPRDQTTVDRPDATD